MRKSIEHLNCITNPKIHFILPSAVCAYFTRISWSNFPCRYQLVFSNIFFYLPKLFFFFLLISPRSWLRRENQPIHNTGAIEWIVLCYWKPFKGFGCDKTGEMCSWLFIFFALSTHTNIAHGVDIFAFLLLTTMPVSGADLDSFGYWTWLIVNW